MQIVACLSICRNVSIAWQHPLYQYDVHGIHKESASAQGAQRRGQVGEAAGLEHAEGGTVLRSSAVDRHALVQKGFHVRRARDTDTLVETKTLSPGTFSRYRACHHQKTRRTPSMRTSDSPRANRGRNFSLTMFRSENAVSMSSAQETKSVEASA